MGWLDRISAVDYKINDSLTLPVYINPAGMQHDPQFFPDPFKFDPDRFLPDNEQNIIPFSYLPFGDGPRVCIGRFALMTVRYLLSELVLNMEFRPLPGYPEPKDVEFETKSPFLMPARPLSVEPVSRK